MATTVEITVARQTPKTRRFSLGLGGWIGAGILVLFFVVAILAPIMAPYDPVKQIGDSLAAPGAGHIMGTDLYNRDVFSRVLYGAQVSMSVGLIVTLVAFVVGVVLGLASAYFGSWVDVIIGRVTDALMAVPGILLAIAILAVLGGGLSNVVIALSLVYLPEMIRVVRGQALSVKERLYVTSAVALGSGHGRLILRHIAPHVLGPTIVQATFVFAHALLYESALSFLGLGIQPPQATWGNLVADGLPYLSSAPLQVVFPCIVVSLAVLSVNLFGDALRDVIDPEGNVSR